MSLDAVVLELLRKEPFEVRVAIVGASTDPSKFGHRILKNLVRKGFDVVPIHPTAPSIEGLTAYPTAEDAPPPIHIVDFVVPPHVTRQILERLDPERFSVVWLQPGSFDPGTAAVAKARFPHAVVGDCIMVET